MRYFGNLVLFAMLHAGLLAGAARADDPRPDRQAFEELLTALGEPPQLICTSGMVSAAQMLKADRAGTEAKAEDFLTDFGSKAPYASPFDDAAAADVAARIGTAMSATSRPELFARYKDLADPATISSVMAGGFDQIGLSPDSVIDVTAAYLAYVWAAQEGDFIFADDNRMKAAVVAIRNQVTLAEAACFQLGAIGDVLPDARNLMIARTGFLIDGMEGPNAAEEAEAFGEYVRKTSGIQIQGLKLTANGFE
jgi:hypothetical protein